MDQPISKVWFYAFNPLIILELTGNLHFEGLVLTGILTSIYFFIRNKSGLSSLGWSWAIGIKMTPLMLGLFMVSKWKKDQMLSFFIFSAIFISLSLFPLIFSNGFQKLWQSIRLFQSNFEFNASIYYLIKWCSGFFINYNPIAYVGPTLNIIALIAIIWYSLKVKIYNYEDFCIGIVYVYLIYLLVQNVVHPWYIIPAFGVSLLTKSKIFFVWTGLVFLSYNAYSSENFEENTILLVIEYSLLFIFILKEIFFKSLLSEKYQI
ncbi:hypothetical protein M3O96_15155 [Aquiflexum sp. TKW24L]|uniref:hypothetical protein n=1 Tax=Aquiflexum sp. TKW24L TaxID=2942212 RepID=UPI0020BFB551|nr:hypothetical protein [Aquiflexum sp. TKW24L]MCL6260439.1 hypothetical protein [Aquiflexum sp. TKW24L]